MNLADKIVMRPIGALIPYASNARTHSDAQIAQIAGSIREFGFTNPVLTDGDNGIIAGHGRVTSCRRPIASHSFRFCHLKRDPRCTPSLVPLP